MAGNQTLALGVLVTGGVLLYAGFQSQDVAAVVQGIAGPKHPNPFDELLQGGGGGSGAPDSMGGGSTPPGVGTYKGKKVCNWIIELLKCAESKGAHFVISSGYRSAADQKRVCSTGVKPCAPPGGSRHQGTKYPSCAVDIESGQQSVVSALKKCPGGSKLVYAGSKDDVHFSHPEGGHY